MVARIAARIGLRAGTRALGRLGGGGGGGGGGQRGISATVNYSGFLFRPAFPLEVNKIVERTVEYLTALINDAVVPRLRAVTPRRSGRLQNSIVAERDGNTITIFARFYWFWQQGLQERYTEIFGELIQPLAQTALNWAVRDVLGGRP